MKKIALIIVVIIFSLTAKAQHFGVSVAVGQSWLGGASSSENSERSGKLFYAVGLVFNKDFSGSKWGVNTSLDFNKRGNQFKYWSTDAFFGHPENLNETIYDNSNKTITLALLPSYNIIKKIKLSVGPHFTYNFKEKSIRTNNEYLTDANGGNKTLISSKETDVLTFQQDFIYTSSFGFKAQLTYQLLRALDLGVAYQYARPLQDGIAQYNIFNVTTTIYFKSRENN
jgi:hypothetical protein